MNKIICAFIGFMLVISIYTLILLNRIEKKQDTEIKSVPVYYQNKIDSLQKEVWKWEMLYNLDEKIIKDFKQ
jgi:hypothetical protein